MVERRLHMILLVNLWWQTRRSISNRDSHGRLKVTRHICTTCNILWLVRCSKYWNICAQSWTWLPIKLSIYWVTCVADGFWGKEGLYSSRENPRGTGKVENPRRGKLARKQGEKLSAWFPYISGYRWTGKPDWLIKHQLSLGIWWIMHAMFLTMALNSDFVSLVSECVDDTVRLQNLFCSFGWFLFLLQYKLLCGTSIQV